MKTSWAVDHSPQLDEVSVLNRPPVIPAPEPKVAERPLRQTERKKGDTHYPNKTKSTQRPKKKQPVEEGKSRVATVAIITCSLVMVAAIAIFLVVIFNGNLFGMSSNLVQVPDLTGKDYTNLPAYTDFEIVFDKEIHHDLIPEGQVVSHKPEAGEWVARGNKIYVTVSLGKANNTIRMSDVVGQDHRQVQRVLENMDLRLQVDLEEIFDDTIPEGYIVKTEPVANTELHAGDVITLYVSMGPNIKISQMPNVVGETVEDARDTLKRQDLDLQIDIVEIFDNSVESGRVIRSNPYRGEDLKTRQTVILYVSKGPEKAMMPSVVYWEFKEATAQLNKYGFDIVDYEWVHDSKIEKGLVISQSPDAHKEFSVHTKIVLTVSLGPEEPPEEETTESVPETTEGSIVG